jgi:hypothetical protein
MGMEVSTIENVDYLNLGKQPHTGCWSKGEALESADKRTLLVLLGVGIAIGKLHNDLEHVVLSAVVVQVT